MLFWLNVVAARGESVESIVRGHWARFGRNYYTRYDYEEIASEDAAALMANLRTRLPSLAGAVLGGRRVAGADDFAYLDPVDGSSSTGQGLRVLFEDGARIIYRLSGTGTAGATLRVYIESFETAAESLNPGVADALAPLVGVALELADVRARTGRDRPTVIT